MSHRPEWLAEGANKLIERLGRPRVDGVDFDVAIVGSGYGGAVAAARFANAHDPVSKRNLTVCVLERGAEYVPGTFPAGIADVPWHVRLSRPDDADVKGRADGLYDFRLGKDVSALVGNGLGGGSLINASVAERPEDDVLNDKHWPAALRRDLPELDEMYDKARDMLGAKKADVEGLAKHRALRRFASSLGLKAKRAHIAVRKESKINVHGVAQQKCVRCGDCVTGCNFAAKNTLPMNYLAEAKRLRASIYVGATVSHVVKDGDAWSIVWRRTAAQHPPKADPAAPADSARDDTYVLRARHVVISAGTFGSTEILMRSREHGLHLSRKLGKRFSTNGDMISVLYGERERVNAAPEEQSALEEREVGPTITGMFASKDAREKRVVVEELAIPGALQHLFREIVTTGALPVQLGRTDESLHRTDEIDPAAVDPERIMNTQVFAAMGDDGARGELGLVEGWRKAGPDGAIRVEWEKAADEPVYLRQDELLEQSENLGGMYLRSPLWKPLPETLSRMLSGKKPDGSLLTVHPLGGCPMGDNWDVGVVDDIGRVYDPVEAADSARVHTGLLVLDGSIIPVALGINPLLTITAIAERAARHYARLQGWVEHNERDDLRPLPALGPRQPKPASTAVRFTERMTGSLLLQRSGKEYEVALEATFAEIPDIHEFLRNGPHEAKLKGTLKVCTTPEDERKEDRKKAGVGMPEKDRDWVGTSVEGTVHWMERAPSCFFTRAVRALWAWLRTRALADLWQKHREGGCKEVLKTLWQSGALLELASNVGEVRYLRYRLTLDEAIEITKGLSLPAGTVMHGLKTFRYAYGENPWQQLSWLTVHFQPSGILTKFKAGTLEIDLRHLVERFTARFQITRQRDQPSAMLDVASIGLMLLRIVLKIHFWSFRAPEYEKYDGARAQRRMPGELGKLKPDVHWTAPFMATRPEPDQKPERLRLPLTRYRNPDVKQVDGPPVMLLHGFGSGGIQFAHPKLKHSLAKHLADRGHDVWVAELRTSIALASSRDQWTLDDIAREDIPELAEEVMRQTQPNVPEKDRRIDVVAHCIGSAMFCTAVLGDKKARFYPHVHSATLLQVGPLITLSPGNRFRGYMAAAMRRFMLADHVDSSIDDRATAFDTILDRVLATYPYPRDEWQRHKLSPPCKPHTHIANCNRSAAVFSRLVQHDKVSDSTLDLLGDMIGHTNLTTFEQTAQYAFAERLTDRDACNLYVTDDNVRERFCFPVLFLHGEKNDVFAPETARRSHRLLQDLFDQMHPSEVQILDGYGHLDPLIGDHANQDVFPRISAFLCGRADVPRAVPPKDPTFHAYPRRPLIGPLLGSMYVDKRTRKRHARIWCRTDDGGSYAYFLLAVVINRQTGKKVPGHAFRQALRVDRDDDPSGQLDLLGVIDVELPEGDADYEILVVSAHRSSRSNGLENEAEVRKSIPLEVSKKYFATPDKGQAKPNDPQRLPDAYADALIEWREKNWSSKLAAGEKARQVDQDGYFEQPDSVLVSKEMLQRLGTGRNDDSRMRASAPPEIWFALACCRFSATLVDRERADASFEVLRKIIDQDKQPDDRERENPARQLSHLLLIGDQIYSDATAGLFDPKNRRGRFDDSYREVWTAPNARSVLRRLPTYMMMDDHEVSDDWHPEDRTPKTMPRARAWGLVAFEDYQLSHSPRRQPKRTSNRRNREPTGSYHYCFESGGFQFFVCDTRSTRKGRTRIISDEQMSALEAWLANPEHARDDRPMFVVSPSVVLPKSRTEGADDWSGFPGSLEVMLGHVAKHKRKVVFLCGDSHLAMTTRIRLPNMPEGTWQCLCVAGLPLYAPMPFANARAEDAEDRDKIQLGNGSGWYERDRGTDPQTDPDSVVAGDGITVVGATRDGANWRITVDLHMRNADDPERIETKHKEYVLK
jgi:cholesterol oxidase